MITSIEILGELRKAVKKFGTHNLHDKGADEIMHLDPIVERLKAMGASDARKVLEEVHADGEDGARLAGDLICDLDQTDEAWFNQLLNSETLADLY